jgi:hypothetical protein
MLSLLSISYATRLTRPAPPTTRKKKKKKPDEDSQILELSECEMSTKTLRLRPRVFLFSFGGRGHQAHHTFHHCFLILCQACRRVL